MATRRRSRRKTISGNLTDIQKRVRYLETRPSATRLASKAVASKNLSLRSVEENIVADNAIVRRTIAANAIGTTQIEQDSITNALIASNAVNADSFAPGSVGTAELRDDSVTNDKIATNAVDSRTILAGAVGNSELEGNIQDSKISGMSSSKLIGQVQDSQINSLSASKVSGILSTDNIPNLNTSKITSGVFNLARIPEITANRMPDLDASKFTTGIFEETNIPNLDASKITTGQFFEGRIPSLSTQKLTTGVLAVARMPVFPGAEISTNAVSTEKFATGAVTDAKISSLRSVRGGIVNNGLSVAFPVTKFLIASGPSAASGLVALGLTVGSAGFNAAAGNHVHGQGGYSNISTTGVARHTHPMSFGSPAFPSFLDNGRFGDSSAHTGHTSANGSHNHAYSVISGSSGQNASTLKVKKDISDYQVPEIKKLLNLQLKRYKYKNQVRYLQESLHKEWMYGYIAEEVEDLGFKELVGYNEKGEPASLNYGLLSTLVLELVKVQQTEISLIKEKIKRRREKYDKLSS
jgi:hypothetical protein